MALQRLHRLNRHYFFTTATEMTQKNASFYQLSSLQQKEQIK